MRGNAQKIMKIGIISDIHASLSALETAINLLESHNVDQIVCAGDLVERGHDDDVVIQCIQDKDIDCVRGNHDDNAILKRELTQESLHFLRNQPLTRQYELDGMRILLAHGTPKSNTDALFPLTMGVRFKKIAKSTKTDVIIIGHTHMPMRVKARLENTYFFNAGSLYTGGKRGGSGTCAVLTLPECDFRVYQLRDGEEVNVPLRKI